MKTESFMVTRSDRNEWRIPTTGKLHREDGPAVSYFNGTNEWYLDGKKVALTEFSNQLKNYRNNTARSSKHSNLVSKYVTTICGTEVMLSAGDNIREYKNNEVSQIYTIENVYLDDSNRVMLTISTNEGSFIYEVMIEIFKQNVLNPAINKNCRVMPIYKDGYVKKRNILASARRLERTIIDGAT